MSTPATSPPRARSRATWAGRSTSSSRRRARPSTPGPTSRRTRWRGARPSGGCARRWRRRGPGHALRAGRARGHRIRREVGPGVDGLALRRDEDVERPAQVARERARGGEVAGVDIRVLLAVDLDADEMVVEVGGERRVAEALARHHVAPVAGRVPDRDEHRNVALARLRERLSTPAVPVCLLYTSDAADE